MSQLDQIQNFCRLASLCGASEALAAAGNLGLFDALTEHPKTLEELADDCKAPAERLRLLLDVLVTTGALERYGDDFALSTAMRLAHAYKGLHGEHWRQLSEFMQSDPLRDHESNHHAFRGDAMASEWTLTAAAMELAEKLEIGQSRTEIHILDLGCGSAMWSTAMAYREPSIRVTALECREALGPARNTVAEIGIDDRFTFIESDYRVAELPEETFDLALAIDLIQLQPLEKCRMWLKQIHRSLKPGGELALIGRFAGLSRGDLHRALGALELAIRVPEASQHSAEAVSELLDSTQFSPAPIEMLDVPPHSIGLILARK